MTCGIDHLSCSIYFSTMITFPNAKINVGLYVTGKREDGYHNIESIFIPVKLNDALEIVKSEKTELFMYGLPITGEKESNLCFKAYGLLKDKFDLPPVHFHLFKNIPMGAGLGGGSADGAFTLKMLNERFELDLSKSDLMDFSLQLGSDCGFFIENKPAFVSGRGEYIQSIDNPLQEDSIVYIIHPNIHASTAELYSRIKPRPMHDSLAELFLRSTSEWKECIHNQFEEVINKEHPEIEKIKERLYAANCFYASLTGSGSCVYGISKNDSKETELKSFCDENGFQFYKTIVL